MKPNREVQKMNMNLQGTQKYTHWILWSCVGFFVFFITWTYFANIDEVTHAQGKVIPSQRIQIIESLEGGIVKEILVKEGEIVNKGQIIAYLDDIKFASDFKENRLKMLAAQLKMIRLKAQLAKAPYIVPDEIQKNLPDLVISEKQLYDSKNREMEMLLNSQRLTKKELDMTKPLLKSGAVSEVELLKVEQAYSDSSGKISNMDSSTLNELNLAKTEYESLKEISVGLQDRLTRTTMRSPVRGIIKTIFINTVGGVMTPGLDFMEIVPLDDTLLVSAKVKPSDIGFIHQGQNANVKISAYDYSIYGGLVGEVEHISADTKVDETDQKKDPYYEIWVRTQKNFLGKPDKPLQIMPGMTATIDVLTGKKTVFDYLMKPILKARQEALRER